jgi:trk system potassium uptake protein
MPFLAKAPPSIRLIIWFIIPILLGGFILWLPISTGGREIAFIDSLFTATSAFCVTGLCTVNIAHTFSRFGQTIIIILMQLGGLGVMAFSTLFFLAVGGKISTSQVFDIKSTFTSRTDARVKAIIKAAFIVTVIIEGIGVVLLYFPFAAYMEPSKALYFAIFHSVSAFNNAGLSISPMGLQDFHTNIPIALTIAGLIVVGGLGFVANMEIYDRIRFRSERRRTSLHTKLVVYTTGILIISGTAAFVLLEMNNAYIKDPWHLKLVDGLFQSITPRTAGFDTVPQTDLSIVSVLLTIFLMVIGASPGSTGGGIKTTSFAIIIMAIVARIKGRSDINIFRKSVSPDSVIKAVSIFILAILLLFVSTIVMILFETGFHLSQMPPGEELKYLFEAVSAFGTVGLSLGITSALHVSGKMILILLMIIGRVGLLTIFYVIAKPELAGKISYSEESVMIG